MEKKNIISVMGIMIFELIIIYSYLSNKISAKVFLLLIAAFSIMLGLVIINRRNGG
jgi:hypothetical protein